MCGDLRKRAPMIAKRRRRTPRGLAEEYAGVVQIPKDVLLVRLRLVKVADGSWQA